MKGIERLADRLLACRQTDETVCIFPHVNIDGDALGSALALLLSLRALGVCACLPLDEPVPAKLDFLPALDQISLLSGSAFPPCSDGRWLALLVDCAQTIRLGQRQALSEQAAERWTLDHHIPRQQPGSQDVIDTSAAAAAELVYDLILALEHKTRLVLLDRVVATLLMAALISDTGGFVYSNTKKKTFAIASQLMDDDINLNEITYRLFHRSSQGRLRLMGRLFSEARFSYGGRVAMATVSPQTMQDCQATDDDLDGIISHLRDVAGVELAVVLRLQAEGEIRVNLRSGASFDVSRFAGQFGGGGHARAAGMTLTQLTLEEAAALILQKAGELL